MKSVSRIQLLATPWTAARLSSLSITNSRSLLKLMSIESVTPFNHLILCHPLLLLPSIFPSIRVFSNESVLHLRCPKYWSFSFSIIPSNEYSGPISFRMDWLVSLQSKGLSRLFSNTTVHPGARARNLAAAAAKSLQSCPTLCDLIDAAHQAPPSLGFSRQEHRSGLPLPSPMRESEK